MIKSMTAFARIQQEQAAELMTWEIRTVNGRYLDVNFRLPEIFRNLETTFREKIKNFIQRGKVDCALRYQIQDLSQDSTQLNKAAMKQLYDMSQEVKKIFTKVRKPSVFEILRYPGVMATKENIQETSQKMVLNLFESALKQLDETRAREGEKIKIFLERQLKEIMEQIEKAEQSLPEILKCQRENLLKKFEELKIVLETNRLEQEMVLMAQKMDVSEEINRIKIHVDEVRRVLNQETAIGRRLDFLMQELNREANTLGAKSASEITTAISVELKVLIEQMREQIQNIE